MFEFRFVVDWSLARKSDVDIFDSFAAVAVSPIVGKDDQLTTRPVGWNVLQPDLKNILFALSKNKRLKFSFSIILSSLLFFKSNFVYYNAFLC